MSKVEFENLKCIKAAQLREGDLVIRLGRNLHVLEVTPQGNNLRIIYTNAVSDVLPNHASVWLLTETENEDD